MTRRRVLGAVAVAMLLLAFVGGGLWSASNQLLFPSWKGASSDFSVCPQALAAAWGEGCGNLRRTQQLRFEEVQVSSTNGYALPGWLIRAADNGRAPADGAILLVHGGGSDRRETSRHIAFFLERQLDVLTLDLGCHGEAPCPTPGLTYGQRESQDVLSAYLYLLERYPRVLAMGSSVGASAILIALPSMPQLTGVVAENPMASFQRLIRETPASRSIPAWFTGFLLETTMLRGHFSGLQSAENALPLAKGPPLYFIHSKQDELVPWVQSQQLAERYAGPKRAWFPERGGHSAVWDANRADYEARLAAFLASVRER